MTKFRKDVNKHNITCFVSSSVVQECQTKITNTTMFLDNVLRKEIIKYLEGLVTKRDLSQSKVSNDDLFAIKDAFLYVGKTVRDSRLFIDPFEAIEEWIVEKLEEEVEKPEKVTLEKFLSTLTIAIIQEITKLENDFENLVELENDYVTNSDQPPNAEIIKILERHGMQKLDATHISVVYSHQKARGNKAVFLTFDYKTIILKWEDIQNRNPKIMEIDCCDPIYGLSFLR